ncbi:MAG: SRPBCC family protein, partial [Marmoricola sp.]
TDPELFVQWVGPNGTNIRIDHWDARTGGSWRYVDGPEGEEYGFHGCFHTVREDRLVQTFTFEGFPDSVALETMWFEDLGEGRTRLRIHSLFDSYEARDGMLSSGMDSGVNDGYAKLDALLRADPGLSSGARP